MSFFVLLFLYLLEPFFGLFLRDLFDFVAFIVSFHFLIDFIDLSVYGFYVSDLLLFGGLHFLVNFSNPFVSSLFGLIHFGIKLRLERLNIVLTFLFASFNSVFRYRHIFCMLLLHIRLIIFHFLFYFINFVFMFHFAILQLCLGLFGALLILFLVCFQLFDGLI